VLSPFHSADQQPPGALFFFGGQDKAGVLVELESFSVSGDVLAAPSTVISGMLPFCSQIVAVNISRCKLYTYFLGLFTSKPDTSLMLLLHFVWIVEVDSNKS
jgi:hypothetical protein